MLYQDGAKAINVSWSNSGLSPTVAQEITENGTTLIVSAGNSPTSYNHAAIANIPGVIVVSGVNANGEHGPTGFAHNSLVDLCAPSINIPVAMPQAQYTTHNGTSLAAPFVSGTIGLMLSVNPCLTPALIEQIIKETTTEITDVVDFEDLVGTGILNSYKAVLKAQELASDLTIETTEYDETCINTPITIGENLSNIGNIEWSYLEQTLNENSNQIEVAPTSLGTHIYTLSYTTPIGCQVITDYTINVVLGTCYCGNYYHHENYTVSSDETWTTETLPITMNVVAPQGVLRIKNQLTVDNGATLTFDPNTTIEFGTYRRIRVEKGARLIVNGATLTKACDDYWYGIEVIGDENLNQTSSNQGVVHLKNQTHISYAKGGLSL